MYGCFQEEWFIRYLAEIIFGRINSNYNHYDPQALWLCQNLLYISSIYSTDKSKTLILLLDCGNIFLSVTLKMDCLCTKIDGQGIGKKEYGRKECLSIALLKSFGLWLQSSRSLDCVLWRSYIWWFSCQIDYDCFLVFIMITKLDGEPARESNLLELIVACGVTP